MTHNIRKEIDEIIHNQIIIMKKIDNIKNKIEEDKKIKKYDNTNSEPMKFMTMKEIMGLE